MRILGPLISLLAIALFVVAMLTSVALTLVVPLIALAIGAAALAVLNPVLAVNAFSAVPTGLAQAGSTLVFTVRALAHPLRPRRNVRWQQHALPDLERLVAEVAASAGLPTVDGIVLTPEVNFGVVRLPTAQGERVLLHAGTPLLFVLSIDELRAVLAHELAHVSLGHLGWARALGRWRQMFDALAESAGASWHPVDVTLALSAALFRRAAAPWSRQNELDADAQAAAVTGPAALVSALRRTADTSAGMTAFMLHVAERTAKSGVGPESWTEAAWRGLESLPPVERARVRRMGVEDPFDIDGCSHPPTALRVAALGAGAARTALDPRPAISLLPDVRTVERRLTQDALRARRWVPAREWAAETAPARVERRQLGEVLSMFGDGEVEFRE